jgi:hypothetical protein
MRVRQVRGEAGHLANSGFSQMSNIRMCNSAAPARTPAGATGESLWGRQIGERSSQAGQSHSDRPSRRVKAKVSNQIYLTYFNAETIANAGRPARFAPPEVPA